MKRMLHARFNGRGRDFRAANRFKAAVACAAPSVWGDDLVLAPANYVRAIEDRPFFMLYGRDDELCQEESARRLYGFAEGPNTKFKFYDGGHILPAEWADDALAFVGARL